MPYVYRVRYSDGEIWVADLNAIVGELSKIEQGFDIVHLTTEQ
jgi:glycine cleavage system protein P-like pyridoxal-binding family